MNKTLNYFIHCLPLMVKLCATAPAFANEISTFGGQ
jgi:hypothetical protein